MQGTGPSDWKQIRYFISFDIFADDNVFDLSGSGLSIRKFCKNYKKHSKNVKNDKKKTETKLFGNTNSLACDQQFLEKLEDRLLMFDEKDVIGQIHEKEIQAIFTDFLIEIISKLWLEMR